VFCGVNANVNASNVVSQCELIVLLYSGGVQLTIAGSNLDLVELPQMNVSVIISEGRQLEPKHYYIITVRKLPVTRHRTTIILVAQRSAPDSARVPNRENIPTRPITLVS